jgi:hypothetical protein
VESGGYSKLSWSSALRRYISLPIVSDQLAQLVPGCGGDTKPVAAGPDDDCPHHLACPVPVAPFASSPSPRAHHPCRPIHLIPIASHTLSLSPHSPHPHRLACTIPIAPFASSPLPRTHHPRHPARLIPKQLAPPRIKLWTV